MPSFHERWRLLYLACIPIRPESQRACHTLRTLWELLGYKSQYMSAHDIRDRTQLKFLVAQALSSLLRN